MPYCIARIAAEARFVTPELRVDPLDVVSDGFRADRQAPRDLLVREPLGEEGEHVALTGREPGRAAAVAAVVRMAAGSEGGVNGSAIKRAAVGVGQQLAAGLLRRPRSQ